MLKRNLIIIGVTIAIIAILFFVFSYFYKPTGNNNGGGTGTNFFSNIFPFGKNTNTGNTTPPANISGYTPPTTNTPTQNESLVKVSTMPIAGYGVFMKERFVDVIVPPAINPTPANTDTNNTVIDTTKTQDLNTTKNTKATKKITPEVKPTAPLTEFVPNIKYVEKATGNIYQTFADKIFERKLTNTIIPEIYDAYFGDNGNSIVMRYLGNAGNTIETYAGTTPPEILGSDASTLNEIKGSFLPENITDISVSPKKSSLFYLFNATDNNTAGISSTFPGDKKNQIFSSPFTEWLSEWPNDRMITLTTKPSYGVPGYMYFIDPNIKKLTKILGDINGLTTLTSPSGKLILYSNNNLLLRIYNTDTKNSISLGIKTLPEKCTWNKTSTMLYCAVPNYISNSNYPDTWYQGEVSFSDDLWKINVENGSAADIATPTSYSKGEDIDGIKLSLDDNENYLFFVNKKDSYLWELNLK